MKFHLIINKKLFYLNFEVIFIILILLLCSCQKRTTIIFGIGPSDTQDATNALEVQDGKYQEALERCQEKLQQVQSDSIEQADVFRALGNIYAQYVNDKENAEFYINKAIDINERKGSDIDLAKDYCAISEVYTDTDIKKGLEYLDKAEKIYKKYNKDSFGLAEVLIEKGNLYQSAGQLDEALKELKKAQVIYDKRKERNDILCLLTGGVYLDQKEYKFAEEQYLEAQSICESKDDLYGIAVTQDQLGWLYGCMEDYDKAFECYEKALKFYLTDKDYSIQAAATYNNIAYTCARVHKVKSSLDLSIKANQLIRSVKSETNNTKEAMEFYKHNLSMYYKSLSGDMTEEGYEKWYNDVVINGKDWKETVVNENKSLESTSRGNDSES